MAKFTGMNLNDAGAGSLRAALEIQNLVPVANDVAVSGNEDGAINGPAQATAAAHVPVTFGLVGMQGGAQYGCVCLIAVGSFPYTPAGNFTGSDSFSFRATVGAANSTSALVSVSVNPVIDASVV